MTESDGMTKSDGTTMSDGTKDSRTAVKRFEWPKLSLIPRKIRVLVTGGAGFIGSNLIERLLSERTLEVICLDNYLSGSRRNVKRFLRNDNFEAIRHDITIPIQVECDWIFHLACPASPPIYQRNAIQTVNTNIIGTSNVLEIARMCKARMVMASTSEVYGDPQVHPQPESYFGNVNPCGIRSCYDEGKRCSESLCMDYVRQHDVDVRIARIFNTYGPYMAADDGRVVSNFIVNFLLNRPVNVHGAGEQTRSFCYISDLVDGLMQLILGKYHQAKRLF